MREHKSISIADQIFEQLEHDILIGKYSRGEILTELRLSETLGVSRTPIREALRRLEQEHIIEETPKGALVIGISLDDLEDMYEIRMRLEGMVAARTASRITEEGLLKMREALDLQKFYADKTEGDNSDNIKNLDSKFHDLMFLYSGSKAFYDTLSPIHKKMIKYRKASVKVHSRAKQSVEEHEEIYRALAQHDAKKAEELATQHVKNARDNILNKEND